MDDILLISTVYIKEYSTISCNTSDKYLCALIETAQDLKLMPIIGECLTNKLKELVKTGSIKNGENVYYKFLLDNYIQKFLMWTVHCSLVYEITYKKSNNGLTKNTVEEYNQIASSAEVLRAEEYAQAKADAYCKRMQDYLRCSRELFPELQCGSCCLGDEPNLTSSATTSLWLGGARGRRRGNNKCC